MSAGSFLSAVRKGVASAATEQMCNLCPRMSMILLFKET